MLETYDMMVKASGDISKFEDYIDPYEDESPKLLRPVILEAIIDSVKKNVEEVVRDQAKLPADYMKQYDKFLSLINGEAEAEVQEYLSHSHEFEEFSAKVVSQDDLVNNQLARLPKEVELGMFELHCEDIIATLQRKASILKDKVLKKMAEDHQEKNKALCGEFEEVSTTALSSPSNTEELVELKEKVHHIKTIVLKDKESQLNKAAKRLVFLSDYRQFTTSEMKLNSKTFQWHAQMPKILEEHESIIKEKTMEYQKALKLRRDRFLEELEATNAQVDDFYSYGNVEELPKYMKKAQTLNTKLNLSKEKIQQFNMEEKAFQWELTNYPLWKATVEKLNPFLGLYETAMAFMNKQKTWFESPMGTHDPNDIEQEVKSSWELVSKLEDEFSDIPSARELVINVREKIEDFKNKMPVIKTLGNPGFRERHWELVSNTVGFPVKGGSNLFQILDMGLDEYVSKFEKISEAATKEYNLEKAMEQMVDDWSEMEFNIVPYNDTGTYTLSSMDNIQVLLDDHIVKTQTMRGSPFIKPFEEQIGKWESQLLLLQEIMDEWLKVQCIWLYLEPIFGSPDIMAQMPEEGRRFTTVDKNWRDIMKVAVVDKHVLQVVEIDRILEKLKKSNELLDLIGKGLNDYLERKRQCFPRFFFLSNQELLGILSETKDPTKVQPHLRKCFEGIASLEFDEELEVTKMKSVTGETVPLTKKVSTSKARGQVDKWLLELEVQMRESMKRQIEIADENFDYNEIDGMVKTHPSQAVECVNYITWTSYIEEAMASKQADQLDKLQEKNVAFITQLSRMVLKESDPQLCNIFANTILTQRYFEDILHVIKEQGTKSKDDFSWSSRLRYYMHEGSVILKMIYSRLDYGYEYLSSYKKLVMTPLTESCYQILLMAVDIQQGGLVSGPAATGKTETIKDLAKAVAKQIVSFNCSEEFQHRAFSKFLKGLACCGAWSCFDEFHRIDTQVLSVIAQQILAIQKCLQTGQIQLDFEGSDIKINKGCAIFVTSDSLQDEGGNIPDNLKVLFRPVAMANPDCALIAETILKSQGFKETNILSKKLASMVELCDGLLSSQPHYEFGLRSIISILQSTGPLKKCHQDEDEHYLISRALQTVKYCELLPQDQTMFKAVLGHVFLQCPPEPLPDDALKKAIIEQCRANELEDVPHFLSKVQQLYDVLTLSDGVMLLGECYGGKTMAWKTLAASLPEVTKQPAPACVVINPKALKIEQMYGHFEGEEWKDGILAKNFRQFASMPSDQRKWLIFDGPVDSEWIENMNTVLDENKKLCLMSGEIIPLPPHTNLIFEARDVEAASPSTVSRCGVLYMDPKCLGWNLIVMTWIRRFPRFIPEVIREKLLVLFDRFCVPLLSLVKRSSLRVSSHHLISSLINVFDCFLGRLIKGAELKGMSEHEQTPMFEGMFFFACIWSIGGICDVKTKQEFDLVFRELLDGNLSSETKSKLGISGDIPTLVRPYVFPVPKTGKVFDFKLVIGTKPEWSRWEDDVDTTSLLPRDILPCHLVVPNIDQAKYNFLLSLIVQNNKSLLLVGEAGSGKSVYINDLLDRKLSGDKFVSTKLYFTSHTTPSTTQEIIMSKLDKRRKGVYGPPLGKQFVLFVDDVNMPQKDDVESQPPIELLRQLLDHETWYESRELFPMRLIDMQVIATMRPPDGSNNALSRRFMRHLNTIFVDPMSDRTICSIYSRILLWHLDTKGFSKEFDPCIGQIVEATLVLHKFVAANLLPTPYHSHYIFSAKEVSKVISGLLLAVPEGVEDLKTIRRLWIHEAMRVYYDRLVYPEEKGIFFETIKNICLQNLKIEFDELLERLRKDDRKRVCENDMRQLLFCDFMEAKNDEKVYKEVEDMQSLRDTAVSLLEKYNGASRKPMDLVLFDYAVEHLVRISRVLKQPESHMLLVGVGGSGRQSLSRLATNIAGHEFHDVEMSNEDGVDEWRAELKKLFAHTATNLSQHVLFLYDSQMAVDDQIMEDLNNLLYSGDIPNMFTVDEKLEVIESMRCLEQNVRDIPDSPRLISFYFGPNSFHFLSAAQIGADGRQRAGALLPLCAEAQGKPAPHLGNESHERQVQEGHCQVSRPPQLLHH